MYRESVLKLLSNQLIFLVETDFLVTLLMLIQFNLYWSVLLVFKFYFKEEKFRKKFKKQSTNRTTTMKTIVTQAFKRKC